MTYLWVKWLHLLGTWFTLGWPAFLGVMGLVGLMLTRGYFR